MRIADEIRTLNRRVELLAPAGRWDALEAVLDAGADAVYLSGKSLHMRGHRSDFHFDDAALVQAVKLVQGLGRRIYVTLNSLIAGREIDQARRALEFYDEIGVDAVIVQDLAMLRLAREVGFSREVHASTMMNVHDIDQALALKSLGVDRIITSRDISARDAGLIGEKAEIEVEYFVHGDMCVAQSGQCGISGMVFGKSANRGECMKPCRWKYTLVNIRDDRNPLGICDGHLMSIRDLTLIRQIPELIDAGITGLKIEGRMRDAAYLRQVVRLYREVMDDYYDFPAGFYVRAESFETMFRNRMRELSSLCTMGAPSGDAMFDATGRREPFFLSNGAREADFATEDFEPNLFDSPDHDDALARPELAVSVASPEAAEAALEAGADRIYLAAETSQFRAQCWTRAGFLDAVDRVKAHGAALGIRTPRITHHRERHEMERLAAMLDPGAVDYVLVHHPGTLKRARNFFPGAVAIADFGFNVFNRLAIDVLGELGAGAVVASNEAGYDDARELIRTSPLPVELLVHGPGSGMLLEHCLIANTLAKGGSKDVCRGVCQRAEFALRDRTGELRPVVTDQYCRNHILTAKDLAILPRSDAFLKLGAAAWRIEGHFYSPELVGRLTAAYLEAIHRNGEVQNGVRARQEQWRALMKASPRSWNFGAYAQRVSRSASTAKVMLKENSTRRRVRRPSNVTHESEMNGSHGKSAVAVRDASESPVHANT